MPTVALKVNGRLHDAEIEPDQTLLSVLRDILNLTGTKYGCAQNECAACTVLIDGEPVKSCRTGAQTLAAKEITTIEGLEQDGQLHPVQEAFLKVEALQCGYCTPGMILAAVGLLKTNPNPTVPQIVRQMENNICRCGTYPRIVAAIQDAAAQMRRV